MIESDPENESLRTEMETVTKERDDLNNKMDTEGKDFRKAEKILDDLFAA